ncbi:MAG: sugar kinase [Acidobacteria bacterium]|nr:sugar kinase [Acidobacteriota bacterium]TDI27396.1 MAG: sugar kinase [Acidobacteriota bacterium]
MLTVGSVAFDSIKTPCGEASRVVGGAATYFSVAASFFTDVRMVAVVGDDFTEEQMRVFSGRRIDLTGLQRVSGETFRWKGEYSVDCNSRETIYTHLNVFDQFRPVLPESYRSTPFVFLANIHPALQLEVLDQVRAPRFVAADTMNYWIEGTPDELGQVIGRVDALVINDTEARELSGESNLVKAARAIQRMGPALLVIKRGEHGVLVTRDRGFFAAPAMPLEKVSDPTGAGDTFAGGFMGFLASAAEITDTVITRAIIAGSALASFSVEDFGLDRLLRLTPDELRDRFAEFKRLTHFDAL